LGRRHDLQRGSQKRAQNSPSSSAINTSSSIPPALENLNQSSYATTGAEPGIELVPSLALKKPNNSTTRRLIEEARRVPERSLAEISEWAIRKN
jgi:hypothetical protein